MSKTQYPTTTSERRSYPYRSPLTSPCFSIENQLEKRTEPISNTDQGCQFSSLFIELLKHYGIRQSMGGKGCWRDNVFVECLWRTIKYDEVYLYAYESVSQARARLERFLSFYNTARSHSSLDGRTPAQMYFKLKLVEGSPLAKNAA